MFHFQFPRRILTQELGKINDWSSYSYEKSTVRPSEIWKDLSLMKSDINGHTCVWGPGHAATHQSLTATARATLPSDYRFAERLLYFPGYTFPAFRGQLQTNMSASITMRNYEKNVQLLLCEYLTKKNRKGYARCPPLWRYVEGLGIMQEFLHFLKNSGE